ncbi:MAG: DUF72 domain-containing protein [Pirellulaceae bacterium]
MTHNRFYVGTSGWTYDDWQGRFYPKDVRGARRLEFYATQFNAVEVNATFYRLPTAPMIAAWNGRLDTTFHLVLKAPRLITHRKKLADCAEAIGQFCERTRLLKRLVAVLWQLPPGLPKDLARLSAFLDDLPKEVRHAVEFRHASWWDDDVARALSQHAAAFVAVSHPQLPNDVLPTTDFLYIRFHGQGRELYRYDYTDEELRAHAARIKPLLAGRRLFAFFNNTYDAHAPNNARRFRQLLADDVPLT